MDYGGLMMMMIMKLVFYVEVKVENQLEKSDCFVQLDLLLPARQFK
jgi:hypothetical protein